MKQLTVMLKPASSLCNLRCRYCFYADEAAARMQPSYGVMRPEIASAVLKNIARDLEPNDTLSICFQGGEPTLAGLSFFESFVREAHSVVPDGVQLSFALQTNGILLDDVWCAFLKRERFLVGLSLDGFRWFHDRFRVGADGQGTYRQVHRAKSMLERAGVEYNILTVLTNELAAEPEAIWKFLNDQKIRYVQFIPCLGALDGGEMPYGAVLTPQRYASFYIELYELWETAFLKGHYISVKLFDDLLNLFAREEVNACGLLGFCQRQFVVEADGGVYPCDFYCLDRYRVGNLCTQSLREIFDATGMISFLSENKEPKVCQNCPYRFICGGGCRRMRGTVYANGETVCGHRMWLDADYPRLNRLAERLKDR